MGVAADELVGDAARDGLEVERAALAGELAVEDDLQEEVAESLAEPAKQSSHRLHAGSAGPSSALPIVVTPALPQR